MSDQALRIRLLGEDPDLTASQEQSWTGFLERHPDASLYQTLAWRDFLRATFKHTPQYLLAERDGQTVGVLPLFQVRIPLVGHKLLSIPYDIGGGGPMVTDAAAESILAVRAREHAETLGVDYLELRCGTERPELHALGFATSSPVIISDVDLRDPDAMWKRVAKDQMQSVRKAGKRGVVVRAAESAQDIDAFYRVYLQTFRGFGTPPYGKSYFDNLWKHFGTTDHVRVYLAEYEGRTIAALLLFCWNKVAVSKFAVALPEAVPLRAYSALYHAAVTYALEKDYTRLSWGTSSRGQSGLIGFKERWAATGRPVTCYQAVINKAPPDLESYYDDSGLVRKVWRRLPLPVTAVVGGYLNRWYC